MTPHNPSERLQKIVKVMERNAGDYMIVFTQVDPDAMGAAYGMYLLISKIFEQLDGDYSIDIAHCGEIDHPQNQWIDTTYNLNSIMGPIKDKSLEGKRIVLVDSNNHRDQRLPFEIDHPLIVVDHHKGCPLEESEGNMIWIEQLGASATMVYELLAAMDDYEIFSRELADVLSLGIYIDTHGLMTATKRDHNAFFALGEWRGEIHKASEYPLPPSHYQHSLKALETMQRKDHLLVASVGHIETKSGTDIAVVCDDLIRMEGITLALVWGIVGDRVRISARNTNPSTPLDKFLKERFGDRAGAKILPNGKGEGGAIMELGFWVEGMSKEEVWNMVNDRIALAVLG